MVTQPSPVQHQLTPSTPSTLSTPSLYGAILHLNKYLNNLHCEHLMPFNYTETLMKLQSFYNRFCFVVNLKCWKILHRGHQKQSFKFFLHPSYTAISHKAGLRLCLPGY